MLVLATLGVLLAAGITTAGIYFLAGWTGPAALLLEILISATDPVSVIATFKEAGVKGRLCLLVEAESLFNDGTVAVLFGVALAATVGAGVHGAGIRPGVFRAIINTSCSGAACAAHSRWHWLWLCPITRLNMTQLFRWRLLWSRFSWLCKVSR